MPFATLLAAGGLLFAFDHATIAGKLVLSLLAIASIFVWSIMITKLRVIRFARKQTARSLESQMILLATAVSGSPFLGLLGTVWGVMDAFTGVAEAGSPSLVSMAP